MTKNLVDVKGGQMTFAQRIELGQILASKELSESAKCIACLRCLVPDFSIANLQEYLGYWHEVIEGMLWWVQKENADLKYEPTDEEREAGIEQLYKSTGHMATVMALAKDYGTDPDEIMSWKWGKVFNILYVNLQQHKFERRLMKVHEKRAKNKNGFSRNTAPKIEQWKRAHQK